MFCPRHCAAKPNGPDDFAFHLLQRSCGFQNGEGIRDSLSRLYSLLAADAISPRRAAVLGYLTSLLLRTLPTIYNDPYPQAGTPMSAVQLAEREKAKSLAPATHKPPAPEAPAPALTQKPALAQNPVLLQNPVVAPKPVPPQKPIVHQTPVPQPSAQPSSQRPSDSPSPTITVAPAVPPAVHASTSDHLPKGTGPMPATRAEFAAKVLKSLTSAPPPPTPPPSTKPNPTTKIPPDINPPDKQLGSPVAPSPIQPPSKTTSETISQPQSQPTNQPPNKKSYQVRFPTNLHVTGSAPPWGWTTDP
jgi:hypothetical protein